jgi:two-component system response regulator HydG
MDLIQKKNSKIIKVLHVDRDMEFLIVSKEILRLLGNFEIDLATTILKANRAIKRKKYDVIISGYGLGQKNELEFIRELRARESKIPFIIFSIHREISSEAMKLGATAFIEKEGVCERVYASLSNSIKRANRNKAPRNLVSNNSLNQITEHFEKELEQEKRPKGRL